MRHPPDLAAHERWVPAVIPLWQPICFDCFFWVSRRRGLTGWRGKQLDNLERVSTDVVNRRFAEHCDGHRDHGNRLLETSAWNWERFCLESEPIEKGFQPLRVVAA